VTKINIYFLTSQPNLGFRQFGQNPHDGIRRKEGSYRKDRYLKIDMSQGLTQPVAPSEDHYQMDEIDGITQAGHLRNPSTESIVSLPLDSAHQGEYGIGHHRHVHPTETPTDFQVGHAGDAPQPVLIHRHREEISTHQHQQGTTHRQGPVSLDVISQQEVSTKAREVMEHRGGIPRSIRPTLRETTDEYRASR